MGVEATPAVQKVEATKPTNAELITAAWEEAWAAYFATGKTLQDAWDEGLEFPDDIQVPVVRVETATASTDAEATSEGASDAAASDSDSETTVSVIDLTGGTVDDAFLDSDADFEVLFPGYDPELHDAWWNAEREVLETVADTVTHPGASPVAAALPKDTVVVSNVQEPQHRVLPQVPTTTQATVTPPRPQVIRHSETLSGTRKLAEGFKRLVAENKSTGSVPQTQKVPVTTVTPVSPTPVAPLIKVKGQVPPPFLYKVEKASKG
jgi:hypothetical protein